MKSLLEAGVHFGHRTRRWNPKMKPYIFTERNGIHIIDLQQTIVHLTQAYELVKDAVTSGGTILFVGTKRQAQESIVDEATRCGMPFVEQRWLGGTLTNWRTIRQRIDYLLEIEKQQERGEFTFLPKKEALMREREVTRLNHRLGGLKEMRRLPNLLFIVDVRRDDLAVKEANVLGIPIIAMVDTNCDPDPIDYVIPSNDDAIRAIKLVVSIMANAVLDGHAILSTLQAEEEEAEAMEGEEAMERYLGPSTLAKLQAAAETEPEEVEAEMVEEAAAAEAEVEEVAEAEAEIEAAEVEVAEEVVEAEAEAEAAEVEQVAEEVVEAEAEVEAAEVEVTEEVVEAEAEAEAAEVEEVVEEVVEAEAEVEAAVAKEEVEAEVEEVAEEAVEVEEAAEESVETDSVAEDK
jgi:small subunit ribosomal protein S2